MKYCRRETGLQRMSCILLFMFVLGMIPLQARVRTYAVKNWGIVPGRAVNCSPLFGKMLEDIAREVPEKKNIKLVFDPGEYHFYPEGAARKEYYISNHDQINPKIVGVPLEDFDRLTVEGQGADFVFHGRMLPVSVLRSKNVTLRDFSIDFETPHIAQIQIENNDSEQGITFRVAPWVNYRLTDEGEFEHYGEGWSVRPGSGIAFDGETRHVVYNTADLFYSTKGGREIGDRLIQAPQWKNERLKPGTVIAMRGWGRPTPGIFLSHDKNTTLLNVKVHYSEGMGLLAQLCENVTLDGFGVCLRGADDVRYFTSQADATHFSGCKGMIRSVNGLYEGMMDDAINVHGTYLKVMKRVDDHTLVARYMHGQAWGFDWGYPGDDVQFVRSSTMELTGAQNCVVAIVPTDKQTVHGAKEFRITFEHALEEEITGDEGYGIENLTWTPKVYFAGNTIRNNRARGSLFSTPRRTIVENNLFDHTSGTAILLCGDCNGWYETGACRDVVIRRNKFVNALTNMFQFTNAVISIYPEIPQLDKQVKYFHGGKPGAIRIENNEFDTFDAPILYAKSVDGLVFKNNVIRTNTDFKPFHWNKHRFLLERTANLLIDNVAE